VSRVALLIVALASVAHAAPPQRVLLADPDPELLHAVTTSLAPWKLTVVVEADVPDDDASAHARAAATGARFVVWRDGDQLVVFDRVSDTSERRPARAGRFDAASAAAAGLTVKTMMRLPPPTGESTVTSPVVARDHVEVRLEVGAAARLATGGDEGSGGRATLAVMVRPSSARGWRIGGRADIGTSSEIEAAGFKGAWSDWALLAAASWTHTRGPWELEPWLGAGVVRGTLDGTEMMMVRTERPTLLTLRGGGYLRRRVSAFTAGAGVELVGTPGAPAYTKAGPGMATPQVFEASKLAVAVGFVLAVDLGR